MAKGSSGVRGMGHFGGDLGGGIGKKRSSKDPSEMVMWGKEHVGGELGVFLWNRRLNMMGMQGLGMFLRKGKDVCVGFGLEFVTRRSMISIFLSFKVGWRDQCEI